MGWSGAFLVTGSDRPDRWFPPLPRGIRGLEVVHSRLRLRLRRRVLLTEPAPRCPITLGAMPSGTGHGLGDPRPDPASRWRQGRPQAVRPRGGEKDRGRRGDRDGRVGHPPDMRIRDADDGLWAFLDEAAPLR